MNDWQHCVLNALKSSGMTIEAILDDVNNQQVCTLTQCYDTMHDIFGGEFEQTNTNSMTTTFLGVSLTLTLLMILAHARRNRKTPAHGDESCSSSSSSSMSM